MGADYTNDGNIHIIAFGGATNEAEACWNCHVANGIKEWAKTWGAYETGDLVGGPNYVGATWQSANFSFKDGPIASIHQTQHNTGLNPPLDTGLTAADEDSISCTACHDVHQVGSDLGGTNYESGAKPWLRGTWTSNPFKEDGAPGENDRTAGGVTTSWTDVNRGNVPRAGAGAGSASNNEIGGWQIEQNNGTFTDTNYSNFAGLCEKCHQKAGYLDAAGGVGSNSWTGHRGAVSGFSGGTGANIFRVGVIRGGTGEYTDGYMGYNNQQGTRRNTSKPTWVGGMRNDKFDANGLTPKISGGQLQNSNSAFPISYNWGSSPTIDDATPDNDFHNFPCSKCHNPHASRLPRLMITNCLDVVHNTWDDATGSIQPPNSWADGGAGLNAGQLGYAPTAQNCHRYVDGADGNREAGAEPGWNQVTPW
jgi:hypothetical protein